MNGCVFLAKSALRSLKGAGNVRLFTKGDISPFLAPRSAREHSAQKLNSPLVKQQGHPDSRSVVRLIFE